VKTLQPLSRRPRAHAGPSRVTERVPDARGRQVHTAKPRRAILLPTAREAQMHFIRHGAWCSRCRRSCNSVKGLLEAGLSAYTCDDLGDDRWRPTGHAWTKNRAGVLGTETPWFLLEGEATGDEGGDHEPLVRNFELKYALTWNQSTDVFSRSEDASSTREDHRLDDAGQCRCCGLLEIAAGECDEEDDNDDGEDERGGDWPA
jgi:hypothetical protein